MYRDVSIICVMCVVARTGCFVNEPAFDLGGRQPVWSMSVKVLVF